MIGGNRLAAVSGAGFETVGMADSIAPFLTMAVSDTLRQRLEDIPVAKRLDALMEVRNPIDINPAPMMKPTFYVPQPLPRMRK